MFKEIIQLNRNIKNNIALFIHFDEKYEIKRYVIKYLEGLNKLNYSVVFITHSGVKRKEIRKLEGLVDIYIQRNNKGYDFGGYSEVIKQLVKERFNSKLSDAFLVDKKLNFDNLLICNDSIFFPLYEERLNDIANMINEYDIFGLSDNHELNYHFQSYFVNFGKRILKSSSFYEQQYKKYVFTDNKQENIHRNEVQMTHHFLSSGFSGKPLCSQEKLKKIVQDLKINYPYNAYNPTFHLQDIGIIHEKCPMLKKNLFKIRPYQTSRIKEVIEKYTDYDQSLIEEAL